MPEEILQEENPIYKFMKSNNLTDLNEGEFLTKYSAPNKAKEIHSFMVSNKLTDLDESKFYDSYLKKKDQGVLPSVSSPTQSLSPDFKKGKAFAEKGFLMKPEGTKEIIETPDSQQQGLLLNLVSSLDKGFAKNFISSPIKGLGTVLQGTTKKVLGGTGEGYISDKLIKLGDYLNNAIDEVTPQDEEFKNTLWDQAGQAVGQIGSLVLTGGLTGAAGKGAALVSQAPKGAAITAVKTLGSQLSSPTAISAGLSMGQAEFDRAIQAGATDDQAFEAFYKNAVTGSVLETVPVMQFFKRFNKSTAGSVANYIKTKGVAGLTGGIEEMTTEVMQQIYANKTAKDIYNINHDILDGVGSSGGIGFGIGFLLNAMGANAKILRKQGKVQEADVLENQVKQYEDNLENPKVTSGNKVSAKDIVTQGPEIGTQKAVRNLDRDLANNVITPEQYQEGINFVEKAAQVADKIPEIVTGESRIKSVELLVERNDIKQANDNLIQQKQITDEAYHAGIDEEIKANEEKIKKVDAEVYNIAKKPSKDFGDKKYIVDGEEVSKEAFEALQGKPIGTKTIIEPTEIGGLKVIKRAPDAPNGEAVYEVEGERFMTADGKELGVAKVEIPKQETKPAEVKVTEVKPAEVKAEATPTKELSEGESVEFKTPEGNNIVGEKVIIPGFEKIDMVMVKEGFNNTVYDLASGMQIIEGGDFSKEGAIKSIKEQLDKRNITQNKLYGTIYKGSNISSFQNKSAIRQINPSSMFESYSEKRKAYDKAEYEKLPLKYTPKEIEDLNKLKDKAKENGLDTIVAEIEEKAKERAKEGSYKPTYEFFDRAINKGIKEKAKKEAEKNKVPYPKEYIEPIKGTEESLAKVMMSGKKDKISQVNPDVRKAIVDAWGKYADLYNKYGYKFSESMDEFSTALLRYTGTLNARENREEKLAIEQKKLKSTIEEMGKVYEKEFGKKAEAEVKPKEGEVKVYNAKDLKANPEVLKEDKDYYSLTYPKSFVGLSTNMLSLKNNGFENAKEGDVINIFKKDYVVERFMENKKNPNETKVKLIRVDKEGNLLREQDLSKKEQKEGKAKEFEEEEEIEVETPEQITKDDIKKAEAKFAAAEDRFKKARNKIEATQVKQAGIFGGEQKGMFAMGGEEAKSTLEPLRKAAKEAKAELDNVRNKVKVQEQAQPELAPTKAIVKPTEKQISNLTKELLRVNYTGADLKAKSEGTPGKVGYVQSAEDWYREIAKEYLENDISIVEVVDDLHGGKERVQSIINGEEAPKKTYQEALKEKLEAEKKLTKKIAGEKAGVTRNIIKEANKIEPSDARSVALKYLAGGTLSWEAIDEVAGRVKRAALNTGAREFKSEEARSRDYVAKKGEGESLDEAADSIWNDLSQEIQDKMDTQDVKNALMMAVSEYNSKAEMAQALIDGYKEESVEEQEAAFYEKLAEENKAQILEAEQKAAETNEKIKEEFKEVIGKASKKAKENAKIEFVDRNFEYLKQKIKIEEKCPF